MKKLLISTILVLCLTTSLYGQQSKASDVLELLNDIRDQYGDRFEERNVAKELTLICIEGTNTAYAEIYSKFKYEKPATDVCVIAGWQNVMPETAYDQKLKHMNHGLTSKEGLGGDSYSMLMDLNSDLFRLLNLKRYSIVTMSINSETVVVADYGSDRIEFLKEMKKYFN